MLTRSYLHNKDVLYPENISLFREMSHSELNINKENIQSLCISKLYNSSSVFLRVYIISQPGKGVQY